MIQNHLFKNHKKAMESVASQLIEFCEVANSF